MGVDVPIFGHFSVFCPGQKDTCMYPFNYSRKIGELIVAAKIAREN
jgi:hypothetical protein